MSIHYQAIALQWLHPTPDSLPLHKNPKSIVHADANGTEKLSATIDDPVEPSIYNNDFRGLTHPETSTRPLPGDGMIGEARRLRLGTPYLPT